MKVLGADFVMYAVSDMERSIAFYSDTLGMNLETEHGGMWAEFTATPTTLALYKPQSPEEAFPAGGGAIALAVADVKTAVEELSEAGVPVGLQPFESPVCWIASIQDPDGNSIMLHQRKDGTVG